MEPTRYTVSSQFMSCIIFNHTLTSLTLSGVGLDRVSCQTLGESLIMNSKCQLKHIDLSHNQLTDAGAIALVNGLKTLGSGLVTLELSNCQIGHSGMNAICQVLARRENDDRGIPDMRKTITTLSLSHNTLGNLSIYTLYSLMAGQAASRSLASFLSAAVALKHLALDHTDGEIGHILSLTDNTPQLQMLDISGQLLEHTSMISLISCIKRSVTLSQLSVAGCQLKGSHIAEIIQAISDNVDLSCGFKLNCSGNIVEISGARAIGEAVSRCTKLEAMSMDRMGLGIEGIKHLCHGLIDSTSLKVLSLRRNVPINDTGNLKDLATVLEPLSACQLTSLHLDGDGEDLRITASMIAPVLRILQRNTSLHVLGLSRNYLTGAGLDVLSRCLASNKTLKVLSVDGNETGLHGLESFARGVEANKSLLQLPLMIFDINRLLGLGCPTTRIRKVALELQRQINENNANAMNEFVKDSDVVEIPQAKLNAAYSGPEYLAYQTALLTLKEDPESDKSTDLMDLSEINIAFEGKIRNAVKEYAPLLSTTTISEFDGKLRSLVEQTIMQHREKLITALKEQYESISVPNDLRCTDFSAAEVPSNEVNNVVDQMSASISGLLDSVSTIVFDQAYAAVYRGAKAGIIGSEEAVPVPAPETEVNVSTNGLQPPPAKKNERRLSMAQNPADRMGTNLDNTEDATPKPPADQLDELHMILTREE